MSIKVENSLAGRGWKRKVEWAKQKAVKEERGLAGAGAAERAGRVGHRESAK